MRKTLIIVLFCAAAASITMLRAGSADTSSTMIPASHSFMLGTWNCTVHLAAMGRMKAMTDYGILTISMSPGMTLHSHVAGKDYMSDMYEGYDAKSKTHWLNTADTTGEVTIETSKDGMVFTGTTWQRGTSTPTRDTQTKISDMKIRDVTEIEQGGKWSQFADAVCTKR